METHRATDGFLISDPTGAAGDGVERARKGCGLDVYVELSAWQFAWHANASVAPMADKIKKRSALIEKRPLLAKFLQSEDEGRSSGRKAVKNLHDGGRHRMFCKAGKSSFPVAVRQLFACMLFLGLIAVRAGASAQTGSVVPTVGTIIARMVQARTDNRAGFQSWLRRTWNTGSVTSLSGLRPRRYF